MLLYESRRWRNDIDSVMQTLPELSELSGKKILITGAAGLICSSIVDILFRYNDTHSEPIHILALNRSLERLTARFGKMMRRSDFTYVISDMAAPSFEVPYSCDYIIHGASNGSPAMMVKQPVETMLSNFLGMKMLLDSAVCWGAKRIAYISSSEVYGVRAGAHMNRENEYGFVDILNPRSAYPMGKRATETLCVSYAAEYGVQSVIVRPGHIYGPTASPTDNRVSSAWAYAAAHGKDIVMRSDGSQIRSYCYCLDCASAILRVLLRGESSQAYNISNPDSIISIKQVAELLTRAAGSVLRFEQATEGEKKGFNPMNDSSLDSTRLQALGWRAMFDADMGFSHTLEILKELGT